MSDTENTYRSTVAEDSALLALVPKVYLGAQWQCPSFSLCCPVDDSQRRSMALTAEEFCAADPD